MITPINLSSGKSIPSEKISSHHAKTDKAFFPYLIELFKKHLSVFFTHKRRLNSRRNFSALFRKKHYALLPLPDRTERTPYNFPFSHLLHPQYMTQSAGTSPAHAVYILYSHLFRSKAADCLSETENPHRSHNHLFQSIKAFYNNGPEEALPEKRPFRYHILNMPVNSLPDLHKKVFTINLPSC